MSAFVVSRVRVRDVEKIKQYAAAAAETIAEFGGQIVLRGQFSASLTGKGEPHSTGIIAFPDLETANAWYDSAAYQAIVPLREEAGEISLTVYQAAP